ncbi:MULTISPECIES: S1C family serine protease [Tsukamurella]|uniref:Trypsin-like serine protease n=2 Tax=Tsukamurella TaxID=2060 RepID=A0A5C5S3T4_9ACTN|nr:MULTISPECIES: trypsin-like peptidase domain-containing protein [Tsukamurella]NMD55076.1 trypsin-like serine protease [Tsukamurella columbiensis]TWS30106.1 trypsin-like serine protease [Tsukamurella conjunctivitidis]
MTEGPQNPYDQGQPAGQYGQQPGQPSQPGQAGPQAGQYRPTQQYSGAYPAPGGGPSGYPGPGGLPAVTTTPPPARGPKMGALVAMGVAIALIASLLSVTGAYLVWGKQDSTSTVTVSGGDAPPVVKGSVQDVAQSVLPAVVSIDNQAGNSESSGSGVVISADGKIVTNNHVIAGNGKLTVSFSDGSVSSGAVVGADPITDLAVIQTDKRGLKPLAFADSGKLTVGQEVVAVGAPLGLAGTVTSGIVSALNRPVATSGKDSDQATVINSVQTDAAINPGNSGGALVDMTGRLVGINSSIATLGGSKLTGQQGGSIGLGFAIPSNQVQRISKELMESGSASHAAVGVTVDPRASVSRPGALVVEVSATGGFGRAGIPKGALVTKVDDLQISDGYGLIGAVRAYPPGATVTVTYLDSPSSTSPVTKQVTLDKLDK